MITFVTALYDIGRGHKGDGRHFTDYLSWFLQTLKTQANYIVFTEPQVAEIMPDIKRIKTIITSLEDIPLHHTLPLIDSILNNPAYISKIQNPERIECNLPLYNIIQYSKFSWLKQAIDFNPYDSQYFFWIDAGCSRFFEKISPKFPDYTKIPNRFYIQGNKNTGHLTIDKEYNWRSDCVLVGTFFGGERSFTKRVSSLVLKYFYDEMLGNNLINNEQIALAQVYNQYPELFEVYIELDGTHLPILKTLS